MPRLDGSGPQGDGPLTGRGLGKCTDAKSKSVSGSGLGFNRKKGDRLFSRRRNRGRFFNNSTNNDNN